MGAGPASTEETMEARIARIESDVAHLRTDVADIKVDLRELRTKVDGIESLMHEKFDSLKDQIASAKIWALMLYFGLAAVMLGTLARGFGWL